MKPAVISQPHVFIKETDDRYEVTMARTITERKKCGVHISWSIILISLIALGVAIICIFMHVEQTISPQLVAEDTPVYTQAEQYVPSQSATEDVLVYAQMDQHENSPVSNMTECFETTGFAFPQSDTIVLTQADINSLHLVEGYSYEDMLRFAINEMYARRGYLFQTERYAQFYNNYAWYYGYLSADETVTHFGEVEWYNLNLLLSAENELE